MLFNGQKNIKILLVRIKNIEEVWSDMIQEKIISELNSVDYELVNIDKTHEINLLDFDIINDNGLKVWSSSSEMDRWKILKLIYKIQPIKLQRKEIK